MSYFFALFVFDAASKSLHRLPVLSSSLSGLVKNEIPTSPFSLNPTPYSLNSKP